jgi:ubiquinone/menaquinone biosynthesis C-methylase UbiE
MHPDYLPASIGASSQDVVLVSMVLHHSFRVDTLMDSISAVVRDGGYMVVREHAAESGDIALFLDSVHVFYERVFPSVVEHRPNARTYQPRSVWREALTKRGLRIVAEEYVPYAQDRGNVSENFTLVLEKFNPTRMDD